MDAWNVFLLALIFGLIGFVSPCSLGVNALFLAYIQGKGRWTRTRQALAFMLVRGFFLAMLGFLFGLLGQALTDFHIFYQKLIGALFIGAGILFIVQLYRPPLLPGLSLGTRFWREGSGSAVTMGAVVGLDIPACTSPLVLALLAQTVLMGDMWGGFVALYVFGIGMSLPLLALSMAESPNRWLMAWAQRSRTTLYFAGGGLLILVGLATFYPPLMSVVGAPLMWVADWLEL